MIRTGTFLDLDMGTLGAGAGRFWQWWTGELAALLPERWRADGARLRGTVLVWRGAAAGFADQAGHAAGPLAPGTPATILLDPALVLERRCPLPMARPDDLRRLVALDMDRLSPFSADAAFADVVAQGAAPADGMVVAHIAFLPKPLAADLAEAIAGRALRPQAVGLRAPDGTTRRFNFLPAMQAAGLLARGSSARPWWWGAVALLFALNLGLLVYRDVADSARLQALVAAQRPAAGIARRLAAAVAKEAAARAALARQRRGDDQLATLAVIAHALPSGAWIERLSISGGAVRISGYKQPQVDVLRPLRASGRLSGLRTATSDVAADSGTGQPFDISGDLVVAK